MKLTHIVHIDESMFEAIWNADSNIVLLVADDVAQALGLTEPSPKYSVGDGVRLRSVRMTPVDSKSRFFVPQGAGKAPSQRMISGEIAEVVHRPALTVIRLGPNALNHTTIAEIKPIEIVLRSKPDEVIGYACPICGNYSSPTIYVAKPEEAHRAALDMAQRCCQRVCDQCNEPLSKDDKHYIYCANCRAEREKEKEAERIAKAARVPEAEYDGPVYDPSECGSQEGYFSSMEELREEYADNFGDTPPPQVWACTVDKFKLDADRIIESAIDGHHEDAADEIHDPSNKLQQALDAWVAEFASDVQSYYVDYSRLVILNPALNPVEEDDDTVRPEPAGESPAPEAKPDDAPDKPADDTCL